MRGAPFGESNFSRGLNVLDSPYSLQNGEARDCLNVVSTPRGAVKKRGGSILFCNATGQAFPALAIADSFNRANESPLKGVGSEWESVGSESAYNPSGSTGRVINKEWGIQREPDKAAFAIWNVAEQENPAVSATVSALSGAAWGIAACMKKSAGKLEGYFTGTSNVAGQWKIEIKRGTGTAATTIAPYVNVELSVGDAIGLTVRGGKVKAWVKHGGVWNVVNEATDATYTKGYSGILCYLYPELRLDDFSTGEYPAPTIISGAFKTVASVVTSGTPYLIGSSGTDLYSINAAGEASKIKGGLTSGLRWSVVQAEKGTRVAQGPVYLSNGTDAPLYWTGAAKTTEALTWTASAGGEFVEVPKAKYLVYQGNRVWASGVASSPSIVRFSGFAAAGGEGERADPTNWPKENIVYFEAEDGQPITGLGLSGSYVLVFKRHKTWAIYNLDEGENRRISDSVGCVSHRSICETPQGTFFLTPDQGVFVTNGSSVKEVSRNVRPILQGTDSDTARAAKVNELENAAGVFYNGHYYLSYAAQDGTQKTLDYDTVLQSWWLHDLAGNQWVLWEPAVGSAALYTIPEKTEAGVVKAFVASVYQDSGSNYVGKKSLTAYWISSWEPYFQYVMRHRINQPNTKKRVRQLFIDGKGQVIPIIYRNFKSSLEEVSGSVDNTDMASPTKPLELGTESQEVQAGRVYSLGVARVWGFGFGNNSAEPFEINSYSTDVQFRKS